MQYAEFRIMNFIRYFILFLQAYFNLDTEIRKILKMVEKDAGKRKYHFVVGHVE